MKDEKIYQLLNILNGDRERWGGRKGERKIEVKWSKTKQSKASKQVDKQASKGGLLQGGLSCYQCHLQINLLSVSSIYHSFLSHQSLS